MITPYVTSLFRRRELGQTSFPFFLVHRCSSYSADKEYKEDILDIFQPELLLSSLLRRPGKGWAATVWGWCPSFRAVLFILMMMMMMVKMMTS